MSFNLGFWLDVIIGIALDYFTPLKTRGTALPCPVLVYQSGLSYWVACVTTAANACGSRTAMSASIFRLSVIPAFFIIAIKRL